MNQASKSFSLPSPSSFESITAYLEPPLNVTIPNTGSRGDPNDAKDKGSPPKFYEPLPRRGLHGDLRKVVYSTIRHCNQIPAALPVGRRRSVDGNVWNIGDAPLPSNYTEEELPFCPVDSDPFLPWIHDLFLDLDGKRVQFVAQNKRRCRTGTNYGDVLEHMQPQVALLQPVSVQRISEDEARRLAPELQGASSIENAQQRYRLSTFQDASKDGRFTRFICKFHTSSFDSQRIQIGETLSEYPFNYELAAYRKKKSDVGMLTNKGKDNAKFWTSTLLFSCPLPEDAKDLAAAALQANRNTPMFHVDIIPIRTPPRFPINGKDEGFYLPEGLVGSNHKGGFDPAVAWGKEHVLPPVEASGRWENLPICPIPLSNLSPPSSDSTASKKPHLLSACLWASAAYQTRGTDSNPLSDTTKRLLEWIEFHLLVGFDHIYVYDNSDNESNNLKIVTDLFPPTQVTWIDWPHVVCNNNVSGIHMKTVDLPHAVSYSHS